MGRFKALTINEFKRIGNDNLMLMMALYPLMLFILGRFAVPFLREMLLSSTFDLANHYPAIMIFLILANPYVYGAMSAFMILDDREERTLQAIQVSPIKLSYYLIAKMIIIVVIAIITGIILTYFLRLIPITMAQTVVINIVLALATPFNIILINNLAKNKVEGFAAVKGTGLLIMVPLAAFYLPEKYSILAGIIPGYWPAMAIQKIIEPSFGFLSFWGYCLVGAVYIMLLTVIGFRWFNRKLLR